MAEGRRGGYGRRDVVLPRLVSNESMNALRSVFTAFVLSGTL
jgi:hypothetical protein